MTSITIHGLDELDRKLGRMAAIQVVRAPMAKAIALLHGRVMTYPVPSGKPMKWKSLKQRRWFFAALRDGRIELPYHRGGMNSEDLMGSWVEKVEVSGQTVMGILGNNTSYGPWVMGPDAQAEYHQGTWKTTDQIVDEAKSAIVRIFEEEIRRAINA